MRHRIAVVLLAVGVLVLLSAGEAAARSGGYWEYTAGTSSVAAVSGVGSDYPGGVVPQTNSRGQRITYLSSDDPASVLMNPSDESPHHGYISASAKCKVCHAVHGAGMNPADAVGGIQTEKLLRTGVEDACVFCHVTTNFGVPAYGGSVNYYLEASPTPPLSAHSSGHLTSGYDGCASCHSVHGANTLGDGTYILKVDPARGVTSTAPVADAFGGFGAFVTPVESQRDFCLDCHDGAARYRKNDATGYTDKVASLDTRAQFDQAFPLCGGTSCHASVATGVAGTGIVQLGVDATPARNGRSHVMTTQLNNPEGVKVAWSPTQRTITIPGFGTVPFEGTTRSGNSCVLCHNVSAATAQFPHYSALSNDLIQTFANVTQQDKVCERCHAGTDARYGTGDGGVGEPNGF